MSESDTVEAPSATSKAAPAPTEGPGPISDALKDPLVGLALGRNMPSGASAGPGAPRRPGGGLTGMLDRIGPKDPTARAQEAVSGGGGRLPHADRLTKSFGADAISGIRAHTGAKAQDAVASMGANAFARGDDIALKPGADLHTVAHEVAHVVQQRSGKVAPGLGAAGGSHEREADQVAARVTAGEAIEAPPSAAAARAPGDAVQLELDSWRDATVKDFKSRTDKTFWRRRSKMDAIDAEIAKVGGVTGPAPAGGEKAHYEAQKQQIDQVLARLDNWLRTEPGDEESDKEKVDQINRVVLEYRRAFEKGLAEITEKLAAPPPPTQGNGANKSASKTKAPPPNAVVEDARLVSAQSLTITDWKELRPKDAAGADPFVEVALRAARTREVDLFESALAQLHAKLPAMFTAADANQRSMDRSALSTFLAGMSVSASVLPAQGGQGGQGGPVATPQAPGTRAPKPRRFQVPNWMAPKTWQARTGGKDRPDSLAGIDAQVAAMWDMRADAGPERQETVGILRDAASAWLGAHGAANPAVVPAMEVLVQAMTDLEAAGLTRVSPPTFEAKKLDSVEEKLAKFDTNFKSAATTKGVTLGASPNGPADDEEKDPSSLTEVLNEVADRGGDVDALSDFAGDTDDLKNSSDWDKLKDKAEGKEDWKAMDDLTASGVKTGAGGLGMIADIATLSDENASKSDKAKAGVGVVKNAAVTGQGITGILKAKEDANVDGSEGMGQLLTQVKGSKGDSGKDELTDQAGKLTEKSSNLDKIGNGFGAAADGLEGVQSGIELVTNVSDAVDSDFKGEKVEKSMDAAANVSDITKSVSKVIAAVQKIQGASPVVATTVAVGASVATGSIGVIKGGYKAVSGQMDLNEVRDAEGLFDEAIDQLDVAIASLSGRTFTNPKVKGAQVAGLKTLDAERAKWIAARDTFKKTSALAADVHKDRRNGGILEAVEGGVDVAIGALTLSGVGAPVALALGVAKGLLSLGKFIGGKVVDAARNKSMNKLESVAQRTTAQGEVKADPLPDDQQPKDYANAKERLYNLYYKNWTKATKHEAIPGLAGDDSDRVKYFVWDQKRNDVPEAAEVSLDEGKASSLSRGFREKNWLKLGDKREYPTGTTKVDLAFTGNAHASKAASEASDDELAYGLFEIGMSAFDPRDGKFGTAPLSVSGGDDPEVIKSVKATSASKLLKSMDVTESVWTTWFTEIGGKVDAAAPVVPNTPSKLFNKTKAAVAAKKG